MVHFNASTPSIYDILTGQEKYNTTVGIKLDIILTGQDQCISTVGSNLVQVAAQQYQPLFRLFLSTNGGVTNRTAAVARRQEGKKPDDKQLGMSSKRRTGPSAPSAVRSGCTRSWPRSYRRFGTSWRQHKTVFTVSLERIFSPVFFTTLALFGQTPDDCKAVRTGRKR